MASFINRAMLRGHGGIISAKDGALHRHQPVRYYIGNPWDCALRFARHIIMMYGNGTWLPDDVIVLSSSVQRQAPGSPLMLLEQTLSTAKVPVHVSTVDNCDDKDDVVKGKVLFSTFHKAKGLERRAAFVFGFSKDYFTFVAKKDDPL